MGTLQNFFSLSSERDGVDSEARSRSAAKRAATASTDPRTHNNKQALALPALLLDCARAVRGLPFAFLLFPLVLCVNSDYVAQYYLGACKPLAQSYYS